jgi:hypothetical protein
MVQGQAGRESLSLLKQTVLPSSPSPAVSIIITKIGIQNVLF